MRYRNQTAICLRIWPICDGPEIVRDAGLEIAGAGLEIACEGRGNQHGLCSTSFLAPLRTGVLEP